MQCDVCGLVDPYRGQGDGIGSCDCPRCDCGCVSGSSLCICPLEDDYPWVYDEDEACPDTEVIAVRPGEPPREITDTHLPKG
jgi:hypothetical protein